jgi:hypothetical protein
MATRARKPKAVKLETWQAGSSVDIPDEGQEQLPGEEMQLSEAQMEIAPYARAYVVARDNRMAMTPP